MYFDVAKHLYDVSVMFDLEQIQEMIQISRHSLRCWGIKDWKRPEEQAVIWRKRSFLIFSCSEGFLIMRHFVRTYQNMQRNYVFAEEDALSFGFVVEQWKKSWRGIACA